jgi:hypothetical protein
MNRSLIQIGLPLVLLLPLGCPSNGGSTETNNSEETEGIVTLSMTGDGDGDGDGDPTLTDTVTDTNTGDGDGEPAMDAPDCGMVSIVPEYTPPNVMLVVDASGSMVNFTWDHDLDPNTPDETRWKTLYGVVETIMNQYGPSMRAGIKRFPADAACDPDGCYNSSACITGNTPEVNIALDNGAAIIASIPGPDDPNNSVEGGTPTQRGVIAAVNHLKTQPDNLARYILLITDGAANCTTGLTVPELLENYDETLAPTVQAAYDDDLITTFVVGVDIVNMVVGAGPEGSPEVNPFDRLNEVALAGGAPKNGGMDAEKFFNSTNQDELLTALGGIINEITECVIDLSMTDEGVPDPVQIPYVEFTSNGMEVPYLDYMDPTLCETMDGWTWLEYGVIVTFCGSYCDDFKTGGATFDGIYGCPISG